MYGLTKVALNAEKARAMAKEVGLFPEGNWKWALRNLRDGRGNLLQGKELADAKTKLGAMDNDSYQQLKRMEQKDAYGFTPAQPSGKGTEFSGELDEQGRITRKNQGTKGTSRVVDEDDYDPASTKRLFHTHPDHNKVYGVQTHNRQLAQDIDDIDYAKRNFGNQGFDLSLNPDDTLAIGFSDGQIKYRDMYADALDNRRISRENLQRITLGRNPLNTDMSGRDSVAFLQRRNGTSKNDIAHYIQEAKNDLKRHNEVTDHLDHYLNVYGGRDIDVVREIRQQGSEALLAGRRAKQELDQWFYGEGLKGDYNYELRRSLDRKGDVLHNILSPSSDLEAVHKMHPDGRVRSVYFDRQPRKMRGEF